MTVKKRPDSEEYEVTGPIFWKLLTARGGIPGLILILVATQHPLGRQILGTFGFEFPDQKKITVAAEEARSAKEQMSQLVVDVKDMKVDVGSMKASNAILQTKVDTLDRTFQGFQVDWNRFKIQQNGVQ